MTPSSHTMSTFQDEGEDLEQPSSSIMSVYTTTSHLSSPSLVGSCPLFRHEPDCILKDNDLRGRTKFRLPKSAVDLILPQLHRDSQFLANVYHVMDYSMLGRTIFHLLPSLFISFSSVGVYKRVIDINAENIQHPSLDVAGTSRIQVRIYLHYSDSMTRAGWGICCRLLLLHGDHRLPTGLQHQEAGLLLSLSVISLAFTLDSPSRLSIGFVFI
jgi:hypothetical protein